MRIMKKVDDDRDEKIMRNLDGMRGQDMMTTMKRTMTMTKN